MEPWFRDFRVKKIRAERTELLRTLLDNGANSGNGLFGTALHMAAFVRSIDVVKHLLAGGTDPNIRGGCFDTPLKALFEGVRYSRADDIVEEELTNIVGILLSYGVDLNDRFFDGGSTLHYACSNRISIAVHALLKTRADCELRDYQQQRPLDAALAYRSYKCAETLLEHGAVPTVSEVLFLGLVEHSHERAYDQDDSERVIRLLLKKDESAPVSDDSMLRTLARSFRNKELINLLFQRDGRIIITPELLLRIKINLLNYLKSL
ncbi:ankyrin repeat-containing domain protein [Hypoxylon fuscum]|nr:ankyrin repeat-containing domain protein [Hypoxylon fuscum]